MKRIAGICYIKVDSDQLEVKGSVECPLVDTNKEVVMGLTGPAGFKETAIAHYVKVASFFTDDFPLKKVRDSTDMTVTVELPNGRVYTLAGAVLVGETAVKADEGEVELEFKGMKGTWT